LTPTTSESYGVLTDIQLELVDDIFHETTLWFCHGCDKWFENKDDLFDHYGFSKETFMYNGKQIPKNYFCKDTGKGKETA